jgi:hypothetical protein
VTVKIARIRHSQGWSVWGAAAAVLCMVGLLYLSLQ